jgi:hypothetical protein
MSAVYARISLKIHVGLLEVVLYQYQASRRQQSSAPDLDTCR